MKLQNEYWPGFYVIIESPFAGDVAANIIYARRCLKDSIRHGEFPFASHLLYTQALNDLDSKERELGLALGEMWSLKADLTVFYVDFGMSNGMTRALKVAKVNGRATMTRLIGEIA